MIPPERNSKRKARLNTKGNKLAILVKRIISLYWCQIDSEFGLYLEFPLFVLCGANFDCLHIKN